MTSFDGNLALKPRRSMNVAKSRAYDSRPKGPGKIKTKRVITAHPPNYDHVQQQKIRAIRRQLARQRIKMLFSVVLMVLVVTGIFGLVVYRQARILEQNFENRTIENRIVKINESSSQISEALAQKTNLDLIRHQAMERLGMQDPASSQVIRVSVPDLDRIVFNTTESAGKDNEAYLSDVFTSIEGYFKSMNQQKAGD